MTDWIDRHIKALTTDKEYAKRYMAMRDAAQEGMDAIFDGMDYGEWLEVMHEGRMGMAKSFAQSSPGRPNRT